MAPKTAALSESSWAADIARSASLYDEWFASEAREAFHAARAAAREEAGRILTATRGLTSGVADLLRAEPGLLLPLRFCCCPPVTSARLTAVTGAAQNLVMMMENRSFLPPRMGEAKMTRDLQRLGSYIERAADPGIFGWRRNGAEPGEDELKAAADTLADRLCACRASAVLRAAETARHRLLLSGGLEAMGYRPCRIRGDPREMPPGGFAAGVDIRMRKATRSTSGSVRADAAAMPKSSGPGSLPVLIIARSSDTPAFQHRPLAEARRTQAALRDFLGPELVCAWMLSGHYTPAFLRGAAGAGLGCFWSHRTAGLAAFGL